MEPFDHSRITHSFYKAKAVKVDGYLLEILKIKSMRKPSYMQERRIANNQNEYALTTFEFLYNIALQTIFPGVSRNSVANIVGSDEFNINVRLKPVVDKRKNKKHTSVLLSAPREYRFELIGFPSEKYVGLSKKTLIEDDLPILEDLIVKVEPDDVFYWRNKIDDLTQFNNLGKDLQDIAENFKQQPEFEWKF